MFHCAKLAVSDTGKNVYVEAYQATEASPKVLASERRAVHIPESPVGKFVPCRGTIDFALPNVTFFRQVSCRAVTIHCGAGGSCRSDDKVRVRRRRVCSRSRRLLQPKDEAGVVFSK